MTTQTPAGWYPDPYGEPQLRWWDGSQWTDATHAHEHGQPQQPASGPQPQPRTQPLTQPQSPSQPQSGPGWEVTPANPTQQFGEPTYGQSAYGAPSAPSSSGATGGPSAFGNPSGPNAAGGPSAFDSPSAAGAPSTAGGPGAPTQEAALSSGQPSFLPHDQSSGQASGQPSFSAPDQPSGQASGQPSFQAPSQPSGPQTGPQTGPQPGLPSGPPPGQPSGQPSFQAPDQPPRQQFGQPPGQFTQPLPQQQWGGGPLPGPGYGPPPKQSNPMPWVFGGLAALVVLALIVVAGIFFINSGRPARVASEQPLPGDTYIPQLPSQEPPGQLPNQGGGQFPEPSDGVVTDSQSGLTFKVPDGWSVAAVTDANSGSPADQQWSAGVLAEAQEKYDGTSDWIGNVYTGLLNELYPYEGKSTLGDTAKSVFMDFTTKYYTLPHDSKIVEDKATKVGDKDAWLLKFQLDFSKISEQNGYKWKMENGAIVLVDRGQGQPPAIAYVSVPDNLGTDVVDQVVSSLKPA